MKQLSLLSQPGAPETAPIWRRIAAPLQLHTVWKHSRSGWEVRHCGHPTANFPYYIVKPDGETIFNPANGRGFQRLQLAKAFVELTAV